MKTKLNGILTLLLALVVQVAFAQQTVTGKVTDPAGEPILGATVLVRGSSNATTTDFDGNYSINVNSGESLVFSFSGYEPKTVKVGTQTIINTTLSTSLDAVVVTAYATTTAPKVTGAISTIDNKVIENVPIASFEQILQGRAPGLLINSGSGQPGTAAKVRIRGTGSINGNNDPLYIVDGIQVDANSFASLNSNDFANVSVLKDAQASALYGSRGGNGVIVITTKRGSDGKTLFSYNSQIGFSEVGEANFEVMDANQYLTYNRILGNNSLTDAEIAASAAEVDTDWSDIIYRTGTTKTHNFTARGGSEDTQFYTSLGYFEQEGIFPNSDLQRFTTRLNLDHQSGRFSFGLNSSIGFSKRNFIPSENGIALANPALTPYLARPTERLRNDDGTLAIGGGNTGANVFERLTTGLSSQDELKLIVTGNASYQFSDSFSADYRIGIDFEDDFSQFGVDPNTRSGRSTTPGNAGLYDEQNRRDAFITSTAALNYRNVFNEVHSVSASAYTEFQKNWFRSSGYRGFGIEPSLFEYSNAITPGTVENELIPTVNGAYVVTGIFSLFGTVNYEYDSRYAVDLSVRNDKSSRFSEANNSATFYAVAARWNIDQESFMDNVEFVNSLKLRGSYGTSGNERSIGANQAIQQLGLGTDYDGIRPFFQGGIANESLTWETTKQLNIGVDFELFDSRLRGTVDVYDKDTEDLFISFTIPYYFGDNSVQVNGGVVENKGVEVGLAYDLLRSDEQDGFELTLNGNISYNENEIKDLGDQVNQFEQGTSIIRVGEPIGSHYIVEWAGVNPANGEPLYRDLEGNITNIYSEANNKTGFGTSEPPVVGGFGFDASYKGFTLSNLWTFANKFSRFNNQSFFLENTNFAPTFNQTTNNLNIWQQPGDITDIQAQGFAREFSSKDIEDSSYLRLRNVTLAYNFSDSILSKIDYISGIRLYAQGVNLLTFTEFTGFDPEDDNNIAGFEYPTPRQFTFGIDVNF